MQLAIIGLGKMGANMTRRLLASNITVAGMNRSQEIIAELQQIQGFKPLSKIEDIVEQLPSPRIVWCMLPSGEPTEHMIKQLSDLLEPGDLVVDGANSNYNDSIRHANLLNEKSIQFVDAGVSGGIWGLEVGYCIMLGGESHSIEMLTPILDALAPNQREGWSHTGPVGAGHYTKMIHNGIEYGMMQAFAEGFALLKNKTEFNLDLADIARLWGHGSVVRSWLLELIADFLADDQELEQIAAYVADSGEGRWTVEESIKQGVAAPVITMALFSRFASQDSSSYGNRLLAKLRQSFGGHVVKDKS